MIGKLYRVPCTVVVLSDGVVFLHQRILLQEEYTLRIVTASSEIINRKDTGIVILQIYVAPFFAGEHIPIVGSRHIGLSPLFAEGIVVLAVEVFAACRRHLRHDARTAQMIRQEIVHFRTCSVIRSYDPSAAERLTELAAVVIYQRTSIFVLLTVGILMLNLCAIGKIDSRSSPSNRPRRKTLMAS